MQPNKPDTWSVSLLKTVLAVAICRTLEFIAEANTERFMTLPCIYLTALNADFSITTTNRSCVFSNTIYKTKVQKYINQTNVNKFINK